MKAVMAVYNPIDNGDPISTVVAGISFRAGQPVDISGVHVETTIVEQKENEKGEIIGRGVARRVTLASILALNPYFSVDGKVAVEKAAPGRPKTPKTAEEYKTFALRWFTAMETTTEMGERWKAEESLRDKLGVTDDGEIVAYLRPFYEGRYHELKQAEAVKTAA